MIYFFLSTTKELWLPSLSADLLKLISPKKPKEIVMVWRLLHIPFVNHQLCILPKKKITPASLQSPPIQTMDNKLRLHKQLCVFPFLTLESWACYDNALASHM